MCSSEEHTAVRLYGDGLVGRGEAARTAHIRLRRHQVRHFAEHRRKGNGRVQLLQGAAHTKAAVVVPAVQWAQNSSLVAIAVRFSPKKHGPVSVASVEQPKVLITEKHLSFSAAGLSVNGGKHLRFELELPLAHAIDAEASTWSAAPGGGRLTVQLAKGTVGERWRTLATPPAADGGGARRGHNSTWWFPYAHPDKNRSHIWHGRRCAAPFGPSLSPWPSPSP